MKKSLPTFFLLAMLVLIGCASRVGTNAAAPTRNPHLDPSYFLTATNVPPITPVNTPTLEGKLATIIASLDMGGGGAGFAATLYAQEVTSGKTFHTFLPAGMHGLAVLPTSPPVMFSVQAPGTYVFYARLINEPDSYHYGATGCGPAQNCDKHDLIAVDVLPGVTYRVVIADRAALLPVRDQPVNVPWVKSSP